MSLLFYLFIFAINLWLQKFVTEDINAHRCLSTMNVVFSDENNILIKKIVFEEVHSKEVDRQIFCEKLDKARC